MATQMRTTTTRVTYLVTQSASEFKLRWNEDGTVKIERMSALATRYSPFVTARSVEFGVGQQMTGVDMDGQYFCSSVIVSVIDEQS